MGFYYDTYLCSGGFIDEKNAIINKKTKIASMDDIIELHEWKQGFVKKSDVNTFLEGKHIEFNNPIDEDLFLEEISINTINISISGNPKYILVKD